MSKLIEALENATVEDLRAIQARLRMKTPLDFLASYLIEEQKAGRLKEPDSAGDCFFAAHGNAGPGSNGFESMREAADLPNEPIIGILKGEFADENAGRPGSKFQRDRIRIRNLLMENPGKNQREICKELGIPTGSATDVFDHPWFVREGSPPGMYLKNGGPEKPEADLAVDLPVDPEPDAVDLPDLDSPPDFGAISTPIDDDNDRCRISDSLVKHGPQTVGTLSADLGIDLDRVIALVDHEWFNNVDGKIESR